MLLLTDTQADKNHVSGNVVDYLHPTAKLMGWHRYWVGCYGKHT